MFMKKLVATSLTATLAFSAFTAFDVQAKTASTVSYKTALKDGAAFTYAMNKTPDAKSGGTVLTLAKAKFPVAKNYYDTYYKAVAKEAKAGFTNYTSVSNYATAIIGLTAIGKDATNVDGVNVVEHMLAFAAAQKQKAETDASFALLEMDYYWMLTALDAKQYAVAEAYEADFSREAIVQFLIDHAYTTGGFSWGSASEWATGPDVDSTAMAVISLAPYATEQRVKEVIEDSFTYIKSQMGAQAGFFSEWAKGDSPESVSQLILAQIANGQNPQTDAQFILDNGAWTVANLLTSYDATLHAFKTSANGSVNQISSQQATQALTAYDTQTSYYDLTKATAPNTFDTTAPKAATVKTVSDKSTVVKGKAERYATVTVKAGKKVLASKLAEGDGTYTLSIAKQKAGKTLTVTVTDTAVNVSTTTKTKVVDKTAPSKPVVKAVKAGQKKVTGKAEKGAKVIVTINSKKYSAKADTKGKFSVKIPAQKAKAVLKVTAKDKAGNVSKATTVKVK